MQRNVFFLLLLHGKNSQKYEPESFSKFYVPGCKLAVNHGASPLKSLSLKSLISLKILWIPAKSQQGVKRAGRESK